MADERRVAVHATHEAAEKLGGIGAVLSGLLPEPAYQAVFGRNLLVGPYLYPRPGAVVDDPNRFRVRFDSARGPVDGDALGARLAALADQFGARLTVGTRSLAPGCEVEVVLASPGGLRRAAVDAYREAVRERFAVDLAAFDAWPAIADRIDRRLERLLDPDAGRPDVADQLVLDAAGLPQPGGARWPGDRAEFPPIAALDAFSGFAAANRYLLELQVHTFVAPLLWAATRAVLGDDDQPGGPVSAEATTLFCHDWVGIPLFWASRVAGDDLGMTVYLAHEARIFRLLAEGALQDWADVLNPVCHIEGHDASLYPHLRQAIAEGWDLERMYPGSGGFRTIPYHQMGREAVWFDKVIAVGRRVRDELRVAMRPPDRPDIALCPNGIPSRPVTAEEAGQSRARLLGVVEEALGWRPDVVVTGVMRCELSKAPWRNVGFLRALAERHPRLKVAALWLSAPRPRPTPEQVARWAGEYRWPLDHRPGPDGDLRPEEEALWRAIARLNRDFDGRAQLLYVNQFGWGDGLLGALSPGRSSFDDVRRGGDLELGLSVYEPFGIAPLEPFFAGALSVLSDACGCALELEDAGAGDRVLIGRFTEHELAPSAVDQPARAAIEARVLGELADAAVERLGLAGGPTDQATWLRLRRGRIEAAAALRGRLSWAAACERGLLPALGYVPRNR